MCLNINVWMYNTVYHYVPLCSLFLSYMRGLVISQTDEYIFYLLCSILTARSHLTVGIGKPPYETVKQIEPPVITVQSSGPRIIYAETSAIGFDF